MPAIGLGTASIGRPQYINIKQEQQEEISLAEFRLNALRVLEDAYSKGIRYFDTAPGYGFAEELVIDWVNKKKDPEIEVATKWGYTYVADFKQSAIQHEVKEHSLDKLNEQWNQSKKLLPWLTTYQIHSATFDTGVLETPDVIDRLADLKKKHKVKIGITTTGKNQVDVIRKALTVQAKGVELFDAFQVTCNILDQSLAEIMPLLKKLGKRVIVKEALANGRLFLNENYPHYAKLYKVLHGLSEKYKVGSDAIALRFCTDSIEPFVVLSGAGTVAHMEQNLKINEITLDASDIETLTEFKVEPEKYWQERKRLAWN